MSDYYNITCDPIMYLTRSVFHLILLFSFALVSVAQVVSVDKVKFTSLEEDWLMSEVEISTGINKSPEATSKRFVENVVIRLYLGFKDSSLNNFIDYFSSEVTALILERGDKNIVRFYIPGKIIKQKRYNKPDYYYAEIIVNQNPLKPRSRAYSSNIKSLEMLKNFVTKAKSGGLKNYGLLMPSFLSPLSVTGSDHDEPAYLRMNN